MLRTEQLTPQGVTTNRSPLRLGRPFGGTHLLAFLVEIHQALRGEPHPARNLPPDPPDRRNGLVVFHDGAPRDIPPTSLPNRVWCPHISPSRWCTPGPHVRLVRICRIVAGWGCGGKKKTAVSRFSYLVSRSTAGWRPEAGDRIARGDARARERIRADGLSVVAVASSASTPGIDRDGRSVGIEADGADQVL